MLSSKAPPSFEAWSFDVSSLMVLLGEAEETRCRLAGRSLLEAVVAAPAAGIQCYLKSYEVFLTQSDINYFSPYGCKSAPLRNMALDNVIRQRGLLQNGRYTTFRVQPGPMITTTWVLRVAWMAATWLAVFAMAFICVRPAKVTWVGLSTCIVFTMWSIIIRLIDYALAFTPPVGSVPVHSPSDQDAVIIFGRSNSAFILEGTREEIKHWTSCGIVLKESLLGLPTFFWQSATRLGTLLVLVFIFVCIPNGTTADQLLFVALNIIGQGNALFGYWFSARSSLEKFKGVTEHSSFVETRTHVYARLLCQFQHIASNDWVEKAGFLPDTDVWREWKKQLLETPEMEPRELYRRIESGELYQKRS